MGAGTLTAAADGTIIPASDHNQLVTALLQDILPRHSDGQVTDLKASLGQAAFRFLKAFIASGGNYLGNIVWHHSYNGAAPMGQGYMKADGRLITKANYDAEWGAGSWDIYVITTPLLNKYLVNLIDRYPIGVSATTQDGSTPITPVGNASSQVNLKHTHIGNAHNHKWYHSTGGGTDQTFNSAGTAQNLNTTPVGAGVSLRSQSGSGSGALPESYTDKQTPGTDTGTLSATQSIKPDSIELIPYVRIIT